MFIGHTIVEFIWHAVVLGETIVEQSGTVIFYFLNEYTKMNNFRGDLTDLAKTKNSGQMELYARGEVT